LFALDPLQYPALTGAVMKGSEKAGNARRF
jgi:hypothetical protein